MTTGHTTNFTEGTLFSKLGCTKMHEAKRDDTVYGFGDKMRKIAKMTM